MNDRICTLIELMKCFGSWEPNVRVLGNVQAIDAVEAISYALDMLDNAWFEKRFDNQRYMIPKDMVERFDYWVKKIESAKENSHNELYRGSLIAFHTEFDSCLIEGGG